MVMDDGDNAAALDAGAGAAMRDGRGALSAPLDWSGLGRQVRRLAENAAAVHRGLLAIATPDRRQGTDARRPGGDSS
ncbi:MAG: hypothetical protein C4547_13330 [Phycisphaerales bacterium]|nr:MAG: hypothetical protein C4547_13330 [Phycisphaerales bacterium]